MSPVRNAAFFASGLMFLGLAKAKQKAMGYRTPKRVDSANFDACVAYDIAVVDGWLSSATKYCGKNFSIVGKDILELGPGSDLGNGLYLLGLGARSYAAVDAIDNASRMPVDFYNRMAQTLEWPPHGLTIDPLLASDKSKICLLHSSKFEVARAVGDRFFDVVFSNAAFEHFENVDLVLRDVATILRPGGVLIAAIDLMTHSRWIREKDPNNIYRYPDWLYRLFHFKGIPNRLRPHEYRSAAERNGLVDVMVEPMIEDRSQRVDGLSGRFRTMATEPQLLAVTLCAQKPSSGH